MLRQQAIIVLTGVDMVLNFGRKCNIGEIIQTASSRKMSKKSSNNCDSPYYLFRFRNTTMRGMI